MRFTIRLLGAELLHIDLHVTPPPLPPPAPSACRFEPSPAVKRPALEASGGGDFGFGAPVPGRGAYLPDGERPDII